MSKTLSAFCSFVLLATNILVADTIHFKNGAYIEVDEASEKDGQIEYWMGNTRFCPPVSPPVPLLLLAETDIPYYKEMFRAIGIRSRDTYGTS